MSDHSESYAQELRMAHQDTASFIRKRKRNTRSIDEQVQIAHAMWDKNIRSDSDGLKRKEIENALNLTLTYKPKTSLHHLVEVGLLSEFVTGPQKLAIAEWMDGGNGEIVLGRVGEAAEEGLEALAKHVENTGTNAGTATATDGSGHTPRSIVASELDLVPKELENYLRTTKEPVQVLNTAVQVIKENSALTTGSDYGEIVFINAAYRYRLTQLAVDLYNR